MAARVLIVHDQTASARELEAMLIASGYGVAGIAASGTEAIALVAQTEPDVVLMDIALTGGLDGTETAEAIAQRRPIPIILLTDDGDADPLRRARATEPLGYLVKPFTERELRITVEMALFKEETRRRAHELEDRFFAVSLDMLCFLDFSGYFKRLNPAWERTLGFSREELMSRPSIEFVHPDDRERTLQQNSSVKTGGHALSFENRYLCKDGSYKWLLWNAASDFDHKVIYSVARDITERKHAEEERETLVLELRAVLAEVKTLQEILPICSYCRKIRNDENYWESVEGYISQHTNSRFSHSICPTCYQNVVEPQLEKLKNER
jgi:PAS domain S-box-containing protein